jgi:DNA mismatch repair protein MutL
MPKVLVLPDHIASQIAAGEVVERPASVVKELVENSIDSGASAIVVAVERGCRDIRVSDNGCGMAADDALLAFQRHATSKLRSTDDLYRLDTLGFRGEALPSISSVAKVSCYTRTADGVSGTLIECDSGVIKASETGCSIGTSIEVADLFFNVPARLSFLKKPATEFGHIQEIVQSLAITYPGVSFRLEYGGEQRFNTSGSGDLTQTLLESGFFSGKETLIDVRAEDPQNGLSLEARIASPNDFRGDRRSILSVVNKRPVRCALAYKALDYAFTDLIPRGRFPLAVTVLSLQPTDLDVNIHPTKKEIKYSKGNQIFAFLQQNFVRSLRNRPSIPLHGLYETPALTMLDLGRVSEPVLHAPATLEREYVEREYDRSEVMRFQSAEYSRPSISQPEQPAPHETVRKQLPLDWRVAGYLQNTYILLETTAGLTIVEQHIAHERVLYEKILSKANDPAFQNDHLQRLIISCALSLTPEQSAYLADHLSDFSELGFEFEEQDGKFSCCQLPVELANQDYPQVIQELVQSLMDSTDSTARFEIAKSVACQSAIKNGMPLSQTQIMQLLLDWHNCPRNETCPHGRPIQLSFSMRQLFQMFHPQ